MERISKTTSRRLSRRISDRDNRRRNRQSNKKLTDIINHATFFFGQTEATKKERKGWWSKDIKKSRNELKKANQRFKRRQSIAKILQIAKIKYQQLIKESKIKDQKNTTKFLNESGDENHFWHRYNRVLGRKKNNIVEPILDKITNTYIFEDYKISEKLKQHNINKTISNNHDQNFRKEVEKKITTILENTETSPSNIYFTEDDIKYAIKISNKNSAPVSDQITTEHGAWR